jgi:NAD dependent epimerase/dehydratase family enzyme
MVLLAGAMGAIDRLLIRVLTGTGHHVVGLCRSTAASDTLTPLRSGRSQLTTS